MQIAPGIAHLPSRLCLSDLRRCVPCKYWASQILDCSPHNVASYPLLVHQVSALPSASFRFGVARDTLAVRLTLPLAGRVSRGLSPPSKCALPGAPLRRQHRFFPVVMLGSGDYIDKHLLQMSASIRQGPCACSPLFSACVNASIESTLTAGTPMPCAS